MGDDGTSSFERWRSALQAKPRGGQRWKTRVRVYEAVIARTTPSPPDIAVLCKAADLSVSTFYDNFGPKAEDRFEIHEDPRIGVLLEAKCWTFDWYRDGLLDEWRARECDARTRLEATIQTLAQWSLDFPILAAAADSAPPRLATEDIRDLLLELGSESPEHASRIAQATVDDALARSDQTALGVLNRVRHLVEGAVGPRGDDSPPQNQWAPLVDALATYATQLLATPSMRAEAQVNVEPELRRLLALIREEEA